ncbi:MAG: LamG-like jellyroll fold domain-containing protein [bacterium]
MLSINSITITGTASDNVVVDHVYVTVNGNGADATGTTSWSKSVLLVLGSNVITATAYDTSGNTAGKTITVTLEDCVGLWHLDHEGADDEAIDSSAYGNHGTLVTMDTNPASPDFCWVDGKIGNALELDGVDDYVEIPHTPSINLEANHPFTISYWMYESLPNLCATVMKGSFWDGYGHLLSATDNRILIYTDGSVSIELAVSNAWDCNKWYHIAQTYDSSGVIRVYSNGALKGTSAAGKNLITNAEPLYIGADDGVRYYFNGAIDEVRIYSKALTAEEIEELFLVGTRSPFFANKIEVEAGGRLMLHPKLPYIEGLPDEEYNLVLNFPDAISLNDLQVLGTDLKDRAPSISETVVDEEIRRELFYKPDLSMLIDGMELHLLTYNTNGDGMYIPTIKFSGTFDWMTFSREMRVSEDIVGVKPLLLKWDSNPIQTGTLSFASLQIREVDSGLTVFNFHPDEPVVMQLGVGLQAYWLSTETVELIPGRKYMIECQAKGETIVGPDAVLSIKDALTNKVCYTRTLVFDIAPGVSLPDKLLWRIEDNDGQVYEMNELTLVAANARIAPAVTDTSSWICETLLQKETLPVQELYIGKLHSWGLNTIEPDMRVPAYDAPLTEESLSMPVAQEAKLLGMRVRTYLSFLYRNINSASYLIANPQAAMIDPLGRTSKVPYICPTHYLAEGNPWLNYYLDAIRESVEINDLDGVFYDYEINAAPYRKVGSDNVAYPPDEPRIWNSPCICERCRTAFQAGIGLDHVPSIDECCEDLYEEWTDFRCCQNIELWSLTSQAAKAGNSNATFAIYSGPPGDYSRQTYGVDWIMAAPYLDFAMQRYFSPIPVQAADGFSSALTMGIPVGQAPPKMLFQLNVFPYSDQWKYGVDDNRVYAQLLNMKNDIVRTVAICRSFGWSFTGIWGMDDQLTLPIKEANALLAAYEDYFVSGEKVEDLVIVLEGDVETATWQWGTGMVTFVFNRKALVQDVVLKMDDPSIEAAFKVEAYDCHVNEW